MSFRLTYATMFNPPEQIHQRFEDALAAVSNTLGAEHAEYAWLSMEAAAVRFTWPRASQALNEIQKLLATGDAGPAEDVLRVR